MTAGRVAIVTGILVRHDAISNIIRHQTEVLTEAGYTVHPIVMHHDDEAPVDSCLAHSAWSLCRHPHYVDADLVIFHFGIHYDLFDALVLPHPGGAARVVHFHNVTPPDLLSGDTRRHAQRGLIQLALADRADAVWSDSPHNSEVLVDWTDVPPDRIELLRPAVMHLCDAPDRGPRADDGVHVVSVGRFVAAKGLSDLVAAIAELPEATLRRLTLTLAGSVSNSDSAYLDRLRAEIADAGLSNVVTIATDRSDDEICDLLRRADLFVSASHHEGFCVPAVEALAADCPAVVTDAGALRDTIGPGALAVVPVADPAALRDAIAAALAELDLVAAGDAAASARADQRAEAVRRHLTMFEPANVAERLLELTRRALDLRATAST